MGIKYHTKVALGIRYLNRDWLKYHHVETQVESLI